MALEDGLESEVAVAVAAQRSRCRLTVAGAAMGMRRTLGR